MRLKLGNVSRQAFAQARQRLPLQLLRRLNEQLVARCSGTDSGRWHGLRVYAADGTGVSMPDVPELAREFTYPANQKTGQGFPCAHLLHLFDFTTGMVRRTHVGPRATNDLKGLAQVLADLERDAVLVADRAFGCFLSLALCQQHGIHWVCAEISPRVRSLREALRGRRGSFPPQNEGVALSLLTKIRQKFATLG